VSCRVVCVSYAFRMRVVSCRVVCGVLRVGGCASAAALVWEKVEVGHTPLLAFHSAAAVDDHTIAVFGGEAPDGQPQPDLYLLNTGTLPLETLFRSCSPARVLCRVRWCVRWCVCGACR
jgi:hypothetical protein